MSPCWGGGRKALYCCTYPYLVVCMYVSYTQFFDDIVSQDLMKLIEVPTHSKGNTLDLFITNGPDLISNIHGDSSVRLLQIILFLLL